ncbi:hypothetical protein [Thermogemmatispora sp.]|uniref:hypothetical protein n=1 Tax=Thermogemmatispora sp. TaxID=1968838 RepID=UPI0035E44EEF
MARVVNIYTRCIVCNERDGRVKSYIAGRTADSNQALGKGEQSLFACTGVEADAGQDIAHALASDAKARLQTAQQQGDLRTCDAAVEVSLVENDQQGAGRVALEQLGCLGKDASLDRPHQHVF